MDHKLDKALRSGAPRRPCIAVVDDDSAQREILRQTLEEAGFATLEAGDGAAAIELARTNPLDAMLLDVRMPRMSGLEALAVLRAERPELPILLLTAYIDVKDAVAVMKSGARDYLEKPVDLDELIVAVEEAVGILAEVRDSPSEGGARILTPPGIVLKSPAMQSLFIQAARVAQADVPVMILGKSGAGKEVLARFLHDHSGRARSPFVAVNCAALPENLIESELFGYERGAFTGASGTKIGRFEEASAGTLFLDEIGEMPVALQPKLLRVLEEKTIRRMGGTRDITVHPRILAATNRPMEDQVREGAFREDLWYRLNVVTLAIPPLTERRDDILPLAARFLEEPSLHGKRLSPAAQRILLDYSWPGNVRELKNAVMRAAIMARGSLILPEDFPESIREAAEAASIAAAHTDLDSPSNPSQSAPGTISNAQESAPHSGPANLGEIQKRAILEALEKTNGNKTRAAELLGISRRNLIYKLRSYGM